MYVCMHIYIECMHQLYVYVYIHIHVCMYVDAYLRLRSGKDSKTNSSISWSALLTSRKKISRMFALRLRSDWRLSYIHTYIHTYTKNLVWNMYINIHNIYVELRKTYTYVLYSTYIHTCSTYIHTYIHTSGGHLSVDKSRPDKLSLDWLMLSDGRGSLL